MRTESIESSAVRLGAAALLLVLVVLEGAFPTIRIGPFSFFNIYVYLLAGVALAGYLLFCRTSVELSLPAVALILFVGYALTTILWAGDRPSAVRTAFQFASSLIVVLLLAYLIRRNDEYPTLGAAFLVVVAIAILISFWEVTTGSHLAVSRLSTPEFADATAASSVYHGRNYFVLLLSVTVPIWTWYIVKDSRGSVRVAAAGLVASSFWMILYNGGRAGFLASCLAVLAVVVLWYPRHRLRRRFDSWPSLLTVGIAGVCLTTLLLPQIIANPFSQTESFSIWSRWQLLKIAGNTLVEQPLGYGIGAFPSVAANSAVATGRILHPHSWVAQIAGELGVPGLLLFVLAYGTLADQLFNVFLRGDDGYALPLCLAVLVFAVGSLGTGYPLRYSRIFWVIFGLGLSYLHVSGPVLGRQSDDS
jgi:hypothetical protein